MSSDSLQSVENLSRFGVGWWHCLEIHHSPPGMNPPTTRLESRGDGYGIARAELPTRDLPNAGYIVQMRAKKSDRKDGPAALVRVQFADRENQLENWDLSFSPASGDFSAPEYGDRRFGAVIDEGETWLVTVAALPTHQDVAGARLVIAPAVGPQPGEYATDQQGELGVIDLQVLFASADECHAISWQPAAKERRRK